VVVLAGRVPKATTSISSSPRSNPTDWISGSSPTPARQSIMLPTATVEL